MSRIEGKACDVCGKKLTREQRDGEHHLGPRIGMGRVELPGTRTAMDRPDSADVCCEVCLIDWLADHLPRGDILACAAARLHEEYAGWAADEENVPICKDCGSYKVTCQGKDYCPQCNPGPLLDRTVPPEKWRALSAIMGQRVYYGDES